MESRVNSKGETTVPAAIRRALGATHGTRLVWMLMPDGTLVVRAKSRSIRELGGILKSGAAAIDIDRMNPWCD
jgi:bifunctional DNA-binding transcriptional regulator/antitoxin component of YhaV-PrlF toxin-antitoxin module